MTADKVTKFQDSSSVLQQVVLLVITTDRVVEFQVSSFAIAQEVKGKYLMKYCKHVNVSRKRYTTNLMQKLRNIQWLYWSTIKERIRTATK